MARNRKKKALYEVIGKTLPKPDPGRAGEQSQVEKSGTDESSAPKPGATIWPRRPRVLQFNAGRIELSLPYQLAIALILGLVLLVLVVYRLGQMSYPAEQEAGNSAAKIEEIDWEKATGPATVDIRTTPGGDGEVEPVEQKGNNRIVIQTYETRTQLEPVKEYYGSFEIETEIRKIGGWYYLVTKDKYENPKKRGTEGYLAKQRIIELGADYKAPPGYESFGKKPFHDAYGMRFDD
jgi:hypothetical protein